MVFNTTEKRFLSVDYNRNNKRLYSIKFFEQYFQISNTINELELKAEPNVIQWNSIQFYSSEKRNNCANNVLELSSAFGSININPNFVVQSIAESVQQLMSFAINIITNETIDCTEYVFSHWNWCLCDASRRLSDPKTAKDILFLCRLARNYRFWRSVLALICYSEKIIFTDIENKVLNEIHH